MNEKTRETLIRRAAALEALSKHPSYPEWRDEVNRRRERDLKRLFNLHVTQGKPLDQRALDHFRGFCEGAEYAVGLLEKAGDTLTRALREAEALEEASGGADRSGDER